MIIDAHAHIMPEVRGRSVSGPTRSLMYGKIMRGMAEHRLLQPLMPFTAFPPEMLLESMDWVGVDRAILLQGPFYGVPNSYVAHAVQRWPDRFSGAAYVDPASDDAHDTFARCVDEYGFRIVKLEMSVEWGLVGLHPDLRLDSERCAWLWEACEKRGVVVTLDLGTIGTASYQTDAVRHILERHPSQRIVIAHLAQPPFDFPDDPVRDAAWWDQLSLGTHANVYFDISALPALCANVDDYPYARTREYLRRAVMHIGAHKLMWGTDAPGVLAHATYKQLFEYVRRHCDFLTADDLAMIYGQTAASVYSVR